METFIHSVGSNKIVFSVPLPNKTPVFMSVERTPYENENRGVVVVDAEKFLQLWRNDPKSAHYHQSHGSPATWPHDRKYFDAEEGFSRGSVYPVPLAEICFDVRERVNHKFKCLCFRFGKKTETIPFVSFTNGITRTIWLLSHGCNAFPVECKMPYALDLHAEAAWDGTKMYTVQELSAISKTMGR